MIALCKEKAQSDTKEALLRSACFYSVRQGVSAPGPDSAQWHTGVPAFLGLDDSH